MQPLELETPVMLSMTFESQLDLSAADSAVRCDRRRLGRVPGLEAVAVKVDTEGHTVSMLGMFTSLHAREAFVMSTLYNRMTARYGMRPTSRKLRRIDLGATDHEDLVLGEIS